MKTYSKLKSIPIIIFASIVITFYVNSKSDNNSIFESVVIFLLCMTIFIMLEMQTYKIEISEDEVTLYRISMKKIIIKFSDLHKIKFEGYNVRSNRVRVIFYSQDTLNSSFELEPEYSAEVVNDLISFTESTQCILEFDEKAEKLFK